MTITFSAGPALNIPVRFGETTENDKRHTDHEACGCGHSLEAKNKDVCHIGGACGLTHAHEQEAQTPSPKASRNPLTRIIQWFQELITGFFKDMKLLFTGKDKEQEHVHGPHCNH